MSADHEMSPLPGAPAADAAPPVAEPTALRSAPAHLFFWIVAACGLTLDLCSKSWAFQKYRQDDDEPIIPGFLAFKTMFNPGALFGIGAGKTSLFLAASVLALGLVFWMFVQSSARRWLLHIALGGILAGALGNMYDRMFVKLVQLPVGRVVKYYVVTENDGKTAKLVEYPPAQDAPQREISAKVLESIDDPPGYVRDFIKIDTRFFGREIWPWVFNVADMLLVGGVCILALHLLHDGRQARAPTQAPGPAGGARVDSA